MLQLETPSAPDAPPVFAADIGGSFIRFAYSARPGSLELLDRLPTPAGNWTAFVDALHGLLERHANGTDAPLAISIAGLVDPADGKAFSANIPCITGHRLEQELGERLGRRVFAANDADCLALAEAGEGAGAGHRIVFCAVLGTGVGGGLVAEGRLIRGAGGLSGEWGHGPILNTTVELEGEGQITIPRFACGCGQQGCVDTIGGARGIERLHQFLNAEEKDSYGILTAWQDGDLPAHRTISAYLQLVADPLSAVVNITGASVVPIGGGLANATPLIAELDKAVRQRILRRVDEPLVVPGKFSSDGGLIGAAVLGRRS
ncbi:N-acetylglucosamine kinase [Brucella endophytica]|uniref:N-acetylglucosamine kinase n=1 Tax=Brucella endophytica TaxID=1963359 RepID=A0A916WCJ8_9HYPH|nr:ROK family protein [Brucella endophytica]GGA86403.1 N-acetylglucosamine kinase [Brucella endophytica]